MTDQTTNNWLDLIRDNLPLDKQGKYGSLDDFKIEIDDRLADEVQQSIQNLPNKRYYEFYPPVIISYATGYRTSQRDYPGKILAAGVVTELFRRDCPCYTDLMTPGGADWEDYMLRINGPQAKAEVLIVLMTRAFFRSIWCLEEVAYAMRHGCIILPIRVEQTSERGVDISRDPDSMWPKDLLDAHVKRQGWNDKGAAGLSKITALHRNWAYVREKLMNTASLPAHGTLLTDDEVLKQVVKQVKEDLSPAPVGTNAMAISTPEQNVWLKFLREHLQTDDKGNYDSLDTLRVRIKESQADEALRIIDSVIPGEYDEYYPPVLISCASGYRSTHQDSPGRIVAAGVITTLFENGIECFSTYMTPAGRRLWTDYVLRIHADEANARVLVVLLSRSFFRSIWCLLQVDSALKRGVAILPIRIDATSERGMDIAKDVVSMWPKQAREKWIEKNGLRGYADGGRKRIAELNLARTNVTQEILDAYTVPSHGTIFSDKHALRFVVQEIKNLIGDSATTSATEDSATTSANENSSTDDMDLQLLKRPQSSWLDPVWLPPAKKAKHSDVDYMQSPVVSGNGAVFAKVQEYLNPLQSANVPSMVTTERYNEFRPRFPNQLISHGVADLPSKARILEIGCGPATLTLPLAERGYQLDCIEPDTRMCRLAQQFCKDFENVSFHELTLDKFLQEPCSYDAIVAGESFHWAMDRAALKKCHSLLKPNGRLILFWNLPPEPSIEAREAVATAMNQPVPFFFGVYSATEHKDNITRKVLFPVEQSGLFERFSWEEYRTTSILSVPDYISLIQHFVWYERLPSSTMSMPELQSLLQLLETQFPVSCGQGGPLHERVSAAVRKMCGSSLDVSGMSILNVSTKSTGASFHVVDDAISRLSHISSEPLKGFLHQHHKS